MWYRRYGKLRQLLDKIQINLVNSKTSFQLSESQTIVYVQAWNYTASTYFIFFWKFLSWQWAIINPWNCCIFIYFNSVFWISLKWEKTLVSKKQDMLRNIFNWSEVLKQLFERTMSQTEPRLRPPNCGCEGRRSKPFLKGKTWNFRHSYFIFSTLT